MLVLSPNLVLAAEEAALPPGTPLIGWHNLVAFNNITADTEDAEYPATNLANPATNVEWRGTSAIDSPPITDQEIAFAVNSIDDIDYVGIARHNFGSAAIAVEVGYYDSNSPPVWVSLAGPVIPPDDGPLLFRFTPQSLQTVVVKLYEGDAIPRMAVVYVGKLLVMERGVGVDADFPVPTYARRTSVVNGRSEAGDYLGRIVLGQFLEWTAAFSHLRPDWYRSEFEPFVAAAQDDTPFFYAWAPDDYPYEVAFAWLLDDPMPMTSPITRRKAVTLKCSGIVR